MASDDFLQSLKQMLQTPDPNGLPLPLPVLLAVVVGGVLLVLIVSMRGKPKAKVALHPEQWRQFQLIEKTNITHNVVKFKLALPSPDTVLGLPIGQHVSLLGKDENGKEFMRPYTPTTLDSDVGHVDIVVKIYPTGAMSQYLNKLEVGNFLAMRGPKGRFKYRPNMCRAIGMVAGGTGVTPMYQVSRAILENPADRTKISLIFANVSEDDILLREEIDAMAKARPEQFSVYYVLNQPPEGWTGGVGFVTKDMIKEHLPAPYADVSVVRCGPPPMNKAMAAALDELGYPSTQLFQF
eukprot:TRINITY_DN4506_c0_g2_i1.p1 TRINITY_DN4506_c0_g2~~TRINITY_DN4506_c0_g2_i1.p1  ORF type:complete len:295 (+),score=30.04 TRINITY_DN4506_c0_g2_i1:188-1072(+)